MWWVIGCIVTGIGLGWLMHHLDEHGREVRDALAG